MSAGVVERLAELRDWREADLQRERERAASCGQRWTAADLAEQRSWATVRSISLAELSAAIDLIEQLQARLAEAEGLAQQSHDALDAMMRTWLDYHDAHSLTDPVTGASGNAFDKALDARDAAASWLAGR